MKQSLETSRDVIQENAFIFLEQWKIIAHGWIVRWRLEVLMFFSPLFYHRIAWRGYFVVGCLSFSKCTVGTNLAQLEPRL